MTAYTEHCDGTTDILEFEKTCALPSFQGPELAKMCKQKEMDRIKELLTQEKKKRKQENTSDKPEKLSYTEVKVDQKKDVKNPNAYKTIRNNFILSNPLNGYEFYDDMLKNFCNELDHDTTRNIRPEDYELKLPDNHNSKPDNGGMAIETQRNETKN